MKREFLSTTTVRAPKTAEADDHLKYDKGTDTIRVHMKQVPGEYMITSKLYGSFKVVITGKPSEEILERVGRRANSGIVSQVRWK